MIRLHRTESARVALVKGGIEFKKGMLDKTETLSLVHKGWDWSVSVQHNGFRLDRFWNQADARKYMEYMLEHAQAELAALPLNYNDAARVAATNGLKEIHNKAWAEVEG